MSDIIDPPWSTVQPKAVIFAAFESRLRAVQVIVAAKQVPAFEEVKRFDLVDLGAGLKELTTVRARIAVVTYSGDEWDGKVENGKNLILNRKIKATVIVSDYVAGDRRKAFWGDAEGQPNSDRYVGVIRLSDALIAAPGVGMDTPAMLGVLIPNVFVSVGGSDVVEIVGKDRELFPGRAFYATSFDIIGGRTNVNLGRHPII